MMYTSRIGKKIKILHRTSVSKNLSYTATVKI